MHFAKFDALKFNNIFSTMWKSELPCWRNGCLDLISPQRMRQDHLMPFCCCSQSLGSWFHQIGYCLFLGFGWIWNPKNFPFGAMPIGVCCAIYPPFFIPMKNFLIKGVFLEKFISNRLISYLKISLIHGLTLWKAFHWRESVLNSSYMCSSKIESNSIAKKSVPLKMFQRIGQFGGEKRRGWLPTVSFPVTERSFPFIISPRSQSKRWSVDSKY